MLRLLCKYVEEPSGKKRFYNREKNSAEFM